MRFDNLFVTSFCFIAQKYKKNSTFAHYKPKKKI